METIVASHADFLRGWSRVPAPRTEYEGLWACSKRGLDKLRASEPCESPVKKKKEKQVKTANLQTRIRALIILIRVKHSLY